MIRASKKQQSSNSLIEALIFRELHGGFHPNYTLFETLPDRLRVECSKLDCGSQVILGFASHGTSLLGYSVVVDDDDTQRYTLIQCWGLDFTKLSANRLLYSIELSPFLAEEDNEYEDSPMFIPMCIVQSTDEKMLLITRFQRRIDVVDVEVHLAFLQEDENHNLINPQVLRLRFSVDEYRLRVPDVYHVRSSPDMFAAAFDTGTQILIIYTSFKPFSTIFTSSTWWKKFDHNLESISINTKLYLLCRTFDAENFLVDRLPKQLDLKLVVSKKRGTQQIHSKVLPGTFVILEYFVQFSRFISKNVFEFVLVARIGLTDSNCFVCFIGQIAPKGYRVTEFMKTNSVQVSKEVEEFEENMKTEIRCKRLVQARRKGYENSGITLTNEPVIEHIPILQMRSPTLPFEIFRNQPSSDEDL